MRVIHDPVRPVCVRLRPTSEPPVSFESGLLRSSCIGGPDAITLGHPVLDDYLAFVAARARPNTWLAAAFDLKVFFSVVTKEPADVTPADVFAFLKAQRSPRLGARVVRFEDGEGGLSARTIRHAAVQRQRAVRLPVGPRRRRGLVIPSPGVLLLDGRVPAPTHAVCR